MRVVIRTDASQTIGLGHVKRCLAIAEALRDIGVDVCLVARDLGIDVRRLASTTDVRVLMLPSPTGGQGIGLGNGHSGWAGVTWKEDVRDFLAVVSRSDVDWIIVDHYAFDDRWHEGVSDALGAAIAVVDDLGDRRLATDVVIDQTCDPDHRAKYAACLVRQCPILGGPRFALLGSMYHDVAPYQFSETVRSIGIFMGGVDAADWTSVALRACREHVGFAGPIEIVTTHSNPNLSSLLALAQRWRGTTVRTELPGLAVFFASHDMQIGAGGGATWERCRVGAPTAALVCADNQRAVVARLKELGVVTALEAAENMSEPTIARVVRRMIDDPAMRREMSERSRSLVDGLGARRVALFLAAGELCLRDLRHDDAALIYGWRNHVSTRSTSSSSAEIPWAEHVSWLEKMVADADRVFKIGYIGPTAVGVVRFDGLCQPETVVSIYLDPALYGLGLGRRLLAAGEASLSACNNRPRRLVATVRATNVASRRLFSGAGYASQGEHHFVKDLVT